MSFLHQLATATLREGQIGRSPFGPGGSSDAMASMYLDDMHGVRAPAEKVFVSGGRLLIIGPPGGGKSTLLRAHARALAEAFLAPGRQSDTPARVPLFILATNLRDHFISLRSFVQSLADYCESGLGVRTGAGELERWLEDGSIELLVDGLDELGFDWNATVGELSDLFRRMPGVRGIVSSRPAALTVKFTNFTAYTIADLDLVQMRNIIARITADQPHVARRFSKEIERLPQVAALARNPLLLTIMLRLFNEVGSLPSNRTVLFSTAIEISLQRWDHKRVRKSVDLSNLYEFLAATAAIMFEQSQTTVSRQTVAEIARDVLDDGSFSFEEIEHELLSNGLFTEVGLGIFGFSHKVFVEYFVAWFYRDNLAKLTEFLSHEDGEAVLEFASGMVENPALLVERAVSRGQLVLAARMASSGRFDNRTLQTYVAQAFRQALEPSFLDLLIDRNEESDSTRGPRTEEHPESVGPDVAATPDSRTQPARTEEVLDVAAAGSSSADEPPPSERLLELLDGVRNEALPKSRAGEALRDLRGDAFRGSLQGRAYELFDRSGGDRSDP